MSLEVEGGGATCVECGEFDFLPTTCPQCHGVFCRDHAYEHHAHAGDDGEGRRPGPPQAVEWCVPPHWRSGQPPPRRSEALDARPQGGPRPGSGSARCFLCPSAYCVLAPCPRCGHHFCAAHRFHGHEEEDGEEAEGTPATRNKRFTPRQVPKARQRHKADVPSNLLTKACATYRQATMLSLAPPGYRSRMMELVAILCRLEEEGVGERSGDGDGDGDGGAAGSVANPPLPRRWEVAVCSLSVAVEATVGQMMQRGFSVLGLAGGDPAAGMDNPLLQALCQRSCPFAMEGRAVAESGRAVELRLTALPLCKRAKEVLQPGEAFVLRLDADAEVDGGGGPPALEPFLSQLLFPPDRRGGSSDPFYDYVVMDDRVRAAVTRLRLRAHGSLRERSPTREAEQTVEGGVQRPTTQEPEAPTEAKVVGATATAAAPWPFHSPPPLSSMSFHNSKANPLGAKQASTASGGRVLVAVFTQDKTITERTVIPPFVLAVGRDWSAGRTAERVKEEAMGLLTNAADRQAALRSAPPRPFAHFDVYVLGSASMAAGSAPIEAEPLLHRAATTPVVGDGDVLFLGAADACTPGSALMLEIERMKSRTGKELAAQRLDMMKKCSLM